MSIERGEILFVEEQSHPKEHETVLFKGTMTGSRQAKLWRMMDVEDKVGEPLETYLTRLVKDENLPLEAIQAELGVSWKVLKSWMEEKGVEWKRGGKKSWKVERIAREHGLSAQEMIEDAIATTSNLEEAANKLHISVSLLVRSRKLYGITDAKE